VLTHVPPWYRVADMMADAAAVYDGELEAAVPGATYDV
jgi:ribonuclease BN (tRNA processing enzyme)